jgi:hypothetical protein
MQLPQKLLISAFLAIALLCTLFAGLKPKGYRFRNDATWLQQGGGIALGPIGIAYSRDSIKWIDLKPGDSGTTIELALCPKKDKTNGITEIVGIWDNAMPQPLMISQWKSYLMISVRTSKSPARDREFDVDSALICGEKKLIQIVSTRSETTIFVNGVRKYHSLKTSGIIGPDLYGRLILGSSTIGDHQWSGEIYGIAMYRKAFSPGESALRFREWDSTGRTVLPPPVRAAHFFAFNEKNGVVAQDHIVPDIKLQIPQRFHIIKKQVLVGPWDDFRWNRSYFADIAVNLFGLMPLGFFLSLFFTNVAKVNSRIKNSFLTIAICFFVSLCIELIQVYIPTRCSQLSDLLCNTIGGGLGGLPAVRLFGNYKSPRGR